MKKLKLNIFYDLDKETIVDIFHTNHEVVNRIAVDIDKYSKKHPLINDAVKYCVEKYTDIELLLALSLVWNICIMDYHMQKEMDLAFKMLSNGVRMPKELM